MAPKPKGKSGEAAHPMRNGIPTSTRLGDFDPSRPGLETIARNANGLNHWMVDCQGKLLRKDWRVHPGWDGEGEYVQAVNWDGKPGTEVLYVERHVGHEGRRAIRSRMVGCVHDYRPSDDALFCRRRHGRHSGLDGADKTQRLQSLRSGRFGREEPDRVTRGDCSPRVPTDPDVLALEHPVPQSHDYYVLPGGESSAGEAGNASSAD